MTQKILLVEDQPIVLKIMENQFNKAGFKVTCCENGKEAQNLFSKETFDIVITDLLMPQACGLELLVYVREQCHSKIPVIIFSEINMEDKAKEAMLIGANYYIKKPFDMSKLLFVVDKIIGN